MRGHSRKGMRRLKMRSSLGGDGAISEDVEQGLTFTQSSEGVLTAFVSEWTVVDDLSLPLESDGTYNFNVDWGDGSDDDITTWNQAETTHTYGSPGTYTVTITGVLQGWRFANGGSAALLDEISQWGNLNLGNNGGYFHGCTNLNVTANDSPTIGTSLQNAFNNCTSLTSIGGEWDMSGVTNMVQAFTGTALADDINGWDVSSVLNFDTIFKDATTFNQNISDWDVSSATNMSNMFYNTAFNQDISSWNVANVTTFQGMFRNCPFNQDISGWTTSSLQDLFATFNGNTAFNQDLGGWDITNLTTAAFMFTAGTALSQANYDALLIGWEGQTEPSGIQFSAGDANYSAGAAATARAALVSNGWTITDGGQA